MLGQAPYVLFALLFGAAVFGMVRAIMPGDLDAEGRDGGLSGGPEAAKDAVLATALRPLFLVFLPLTRGIGLGAYRQRIATRFYSAGMGGVMSVDEFFAYKMVMALVFEGLFGVIFAWILLGLSLGPFWHAAILAAGSMFPDLWLSGLVSARQDKIRKSLPYVMDLLTLSVEAGLDFIAGVYKVCEKAKQGPLVDELAYTLREIQVGASRQQALRNLAKRVDMQEMRSFSALLIQADILGASIGPVLRAQSDLLRTQRFQAAERAGAYAATKLLFPLILFIMPAVFVVIFGPIALNFIYGDAVIGG
jgi:tight adherence protein C